MPRPKPSKRTTTKSSKGDFTSRASSDQKRSKQNKKDSSGGWKKKRAASTDKESFFKKDSRSGESPSNRPTYKSSAPSSAPEKKSYRKDKGSPYNKTRGTDDSKGKKSFFKKENRRSEDNSHKARKSSYSSRSNRDEQPSSNKKDNSFKRYKKKSDHGEAPKKGSGFKKSIDTESTSNLLEGSETIRLNKYISNSGVCSRREADELIKMGVISVNGTVITELGYKVNPRDVVRHEGKLLRAEKPVYILINKPKGFLTTTRDPQDRNTVMQIIGNAVKERVYPVGRLDRNTTGLLLLTNDGELADKLSHPSYQAKKIYKVELDKPLTRADYQKILEGVKLEEGKALVDDLAIISDDSKTIGIELHIGWNRVIRRIFETLGYEVVKLDRSVYAGLDKRDLPRGHWRFLTKEEVVRLKHFQ